MQTALKNDKIYKYEPIFWQKCHWLQSRNFKSRLKSDIEKLKKSLIENDFIMPFFVSEKIEEGKTYILDGHGRREALDELAKEGHSIPEKLPALFLNIRTREEAYKTLLLYNSSYGIIRKSELKNLLSELNLKEDDISETVRLNSVLDDIAVDGYSKEEESESKEQAKQKADIILSFGLFHISMYKFRVAREVFDDWLSEIKSKVGIQDKEIISEFKRRIGIAEHEKKHSSKS